MAVNACAFTQGKVYNESNVLNTVFSIVTVYFYFYRMILLYLVDVAYTHILHVQIGLFSMTDPKELSSPHL